MLAHETYLAGDALRGRGSATPDEAKAADYVAAQFKGFGLTFAPGMTGYLQTAQIVTLRLDGPAALAAGGAPIKDPLLLIGSGQGVNGKLTVYGGDDPGAIPDGDVVIATASGSSSLQFLRAAGGSHVKLLIVRDNHDARGLYARLGGQPRMPTYLAGDAPRSGPAIVAIPGDAFDKLAKQPGADVALTLPGLVKDAKHHHQRDRLSPRHRSQGGRGALHRASRPSRRPSRRHDHARRQRRRLGHHRGDRDRARAGGRPAPAPRHPVRLLRQRGEPANSARTISASTRRCRSPTSSPTSSSR